MLDNKKDENELEELVTDLENKEKNEDISFTTTNVEIPNEENIENKTNELQEENEEEYEKDLSLNILEADKESKDTSEEAVTKEEIDEYPYIQQDLTVEKLVDVIDKSNKEELNSLIDLLPVSLLAEYVQDLDDVHLVMFYKLANTDIAAELFSYLDSDQQTQVIKAFSNDEIKHLVAEMSTDDLVDFVDELPSNLVDRVLQATSKNDRNKINMFLEFKDGTAGSIMTTEYLDVTQDMTVTEAFDKIRKIGKEVETIQRLFVLDNSRILIGVVALDDLIFANPEEKIEDIMMTDYAFGYTQTDQEEISQLFKKYDLTVLPITNSYKRLLGIITVDDIMDVVEEETTEDMNKMSGISGKTTKPYFQTTIFKTALSCFPWLLVLLVIGTFTTLIIDRYEKVVLASLPVLSVFVPTLMDTGGNSGNQSTTVITRALSLKEIEPKDWYKVVGKEMASGAIIGLIVGVFSFCWFLFETSVGIVNIDANKFQSFSSLQIKSILAAIVSLCIFIVILLSRFLGAVLPILAKLIHLDPAVMAGPLITTTLDCCSLLIYFSLAQAILAPLLVA